MIAHKRIVLQIGAVFLLVSLKIHGGVSRSITDTSSQIESGSSLELSRNGSHLMSQTALFSNVSSVSLPRAFNNSSTEKVNSSSDLSNSSYRKSEVSNASETSRTGVSIAGIATNNQKAPQVPEESTNNVPIEKTAVQPSIGITVENSSSTPQNAQSYAKLSIEESPTFLIEKESIKHFGENIQKLKENVNSFKNNIRKVLFESDPSSSGVGVKTDQTSLQRISTSDSMEESSSSGSLDTSSKKVLDTSKAEFSNLLNGHGDFMDSTDAFFVNSESTSHGVGTSSYQDTYGNKALDKLKKAEPVELRKMSAVASNISEVSRKVGEFLQKQYWDASDNKIREQDAMISRGLENLVSGVEESELPSSQVLQQWVNLEESFRESVDAVVRQALPLLVRASSEMQLSSGCYTSFFQLLLGLRRLRPWAFQMIDAFGKPPAGMLQGTVTSFGAYDECVNIVAMPDAKKRSHTQQYFRGKYCTVEIKPPLPPKPQYYTMYQPVSILANFSNGDDNVIRQAARQAHAFYFLNYRMDVCVPSTCTQEDVDNMAQFAAKYIDIEVAVPRCSVKENLEFDRSQVTILCIVGVLLSFVIFGTTLYTMGEIFHKTKLIAQCLSNGLSKLLLSFSLNTNANLLLNTDSAQNRLDSVHGMRFFGMGWLVLGHTYFNSNIQMYGNLSEASSFAEGFLFQIIVNSTVSIDTFFFISGVLLAYMTLQSVSEQGYYSIPRLFIRKVVRILPPYMMVIGATLLLPHLGSGPFWNETVDPVVDSCKQNWWTNILFINNFVTTPGQRCLEHSWYISCDFQLFVIALFILFALIKRPVFGIVLNIVMIVVSMVMTGFLTHYYRVPPTLLASFPDPEERKFLNHVIISKPFCHLGPYCVGLATGYFFYRGTEIKLKTYHHIIGWGSSLTITAAVVYGVLEWNKGNLPTKAAALAYAATHRTAWALGLSWITIICAAGFGGLINSILSWKVFIPLSRLTCMVYLIHPLIQYILTGYIRERLQTNHIILAYFFFGHIMTSYALASACFFLFDGPVESLMRLLLGYCSAPTRELAKISAAKKVVNNNVKDEKQRNC